MTGLYRAVVALHVLTVLGGLVTVGVTGGYCAAYWINPDGPAVRRFFAPGPGPGTRLLYVAAGLGLAAAASSQGRVHLGSSWVWGAALLWVGAAAALEMVMRPAERRLQAACAAPGPDARSPTLLSAARRGLIGAVTIEACLVAASLVMTVKP